MAAASDRHAARLVFQSASVLVDRFRAVAMCVFSAWLVAQIILLCTAAVTRLTMSELTTADRDFEAIQAGRKPDVIACA